MPDEITPGQQTDTPVASGQQENWEARYKGLLPTVEKLTLNNRDLTNQLALRSSESEQSKLQLGIKDTEKSVAVTERDNQIKTLTETRLALEDKLKNLTALELKVKVAKNLGRMDLLQLADQIPNLGDEEALATIFKNFAAFTDNAVKAEREKLLSGVTPPPSSTSTTITLPTTTEAWEKHVNALPLGSKERASAMTEWGAWVNTQNKK